MFLSKKLMILVAAVIGLCLSLNWQQSTPISGLGLIAYGLIAFIPVVRLDDQPRAQIVYLLLTYLLPLSYVVSWDLTGKIESNPATVAAITLVLAGVYAQLKDVSRSRLQIIGSLMYLACLMLSWFKPINATLALLLLQIPTYYFISQSFADYARHKTLRRFLLFGSLFLAIVWLTLIFVQNLLI